MKKIHRSLYKMFRWHTKDLFMSILGTFIFCFAINIFIVPNSLYNGGVLGISQLIRSILITYFHFSFSFDIAGIISFLLNIPLFFVAYKYISKTFFRRTIVCMIFQTLFLSVIPVPVQSVIPEVLTSVLIGAILAGFGSGMCLSASGSGGGTDIIGLAVAMRNRDFSVGRISRGVNLCIYMICGILYGLPAMIYSIIYAVVATLILDHTHKQNICSYIMVFTKEKPDKILKFIRKDLDRDATYWDACGGYDGSRTYIIYSAMSKYEMQHLQRSLPLLEPHAFMVKGEGIGILGNFHKNLTE